MALLIFDMDGTILDSGTTIVNTINHVREELGFEKLEKNYALEKVNDPNINASKFFYGTDDFTLQQKELFEEHYNANCLNGLELYDGMAKLIDDLNQEFTLTIATNANSTFARKMLDYLEVGKYFETILGFDSVKQAKPHPEMVYKILDTHNIQKDRTQLIGDSHKDIMAANNAGIDSVLVNWGFSNHDKDAISSIEELEIKIFEKFNKLN